MIRALLAVSLVGAMTCMAAETQKVTSLAPSDFDRLARQRAVLERYLADEASRKSYKIAAGKLGLLRALLERRVFKPTQTYELQCMGIVLGDAFAQALPSSFSRSP